MDEKQINSEKGHSQKQQGDLCYLAHVPVLLHRTITQRDLRAQCRGWQQEELHRSRDRADYPVNECLLRNNLSFSTHTGKADKSLGPAVKDKEERTSGWLRCGNKRLKTDWEVLLSLSNALRYN